MTFDNETIYLRGGHTLTPAGHSVDGYRSKGELHLVHIYANGTNRAVVGMRLEPGRANSILLSIPSPLIPVNDTTQVAIE